MTVWPNGSRTRPHVTSPYGYYRNDNGVLEPADHYGDDLTGYTYNCAPESGRIVYSGWNPSGAGYEVRVLGVSGTIFRMLHNVAGSLTKSVGDTVSEGDILGTMGMSGSATGVHCHFEVWPGANINNRMNPTVYMGAATAGGSSRPIPVPVTPLPVPKGNAMTQVIFTNILEPLTDGQVSALRSYVGGASLNLAVGKAVVALIGDCPGTPANVQVTQSDGRANGWAADHAGVYRDPSTGKVLIDQAARPYETADFFGLCAAYAAPIKTA